MRVLIGYNCGGQNQSLAYKAWGARLRKAGFEVETISLSLAEWAGALPWSDLDARWRRGEKRLMNLYERLLKAADGYDVFLNYNGVNIHPEFVQRLCATSVFACFDDPEASELLSKPVAGAYDLAMVGNVAEVDTYRNWGVKEVHWWPLGFRADDYDPHLTKQAIVDNNRDIDVTLLCERTTHYRRTRLNKFATRFPHGKYYGRGWPAGFLPESERVPLLQRTKIGINIHNSTGPVNFRTYYLPANGVLQICDNKSHLAKVFEVGKEVVGYGSIDEAIELCAYFLRHDEQRIAIAVAGWERATRDYNEVACFQRLVTILEKRQESAVLRRRQDQVISLQEYRRTTRSRRIAHRLSLPIAWPLKLAKRIATKLKAVRRFSSLTDN